MHHISSCSDLKYIRLIFIKSNILIYFISTSNAQVVFYSVLSLNSMPFVLNLLTNIFLYSESELGFFTFDLYPQVMATINVVNGLVHFSTQPSLLMSEDYFPVLRPCYSRLMNLKTR